MDGNGIPAPANTTTYAAAFPNRITATSTPMGCPSACEGYELTANLDFAADGVAVTSTDAYPNWTPIGSVANRYAAEFNGNGHTITRLTITGAGVGNYAGLFGVLAANGVIRDLGLIDVNVSSGGFNVGILAGANAGEITASYIQGGSVTGTGGFGGNRVGGFTGTNQGTIRASYSTASVNETSPSDTVVGGLAGQLDNGTIIASYAAGPVSGAGANTYTGGIVGRATSTFAITDSYCSASTGQANCVGNPASSAGRYTAAQLQTPTGYTGIFANWNVDLDDDGIPDNPWYFGATSTYPVITDPKTSDPPAANQRTIDHDPDDDGLIDVDSLDKLNAIRHDLNGDGLPASTGTYAAYAGAFPGADVTAPTSSPTRMGCPATCEGYELTADLDFAADGMAVTSTDAYPNWTPIGPLPGYSAEFNGNGHTITRLTITGGETHIGLFGVLAANGVIRDLGMIDASVSSGAANVGILAGGNAGEITASYIHDGSVTGTRVLGGNNVGGLTGTNEGTIQASYSTASVNETSLSATLVGGLTGRLNNGTIIASYAAGPVSGAGANTYVGGIVGSATSSFAITDSYCSASTGQTNCVGNPASSAGRYTAAQLQAPTGYTGIFANWNIDVTGDAIPDNPWNFGATTTYPALNQPAQRIVDHDADDDGLIDVDSLDKLNAIRHDLNGDGLPASTGTYAAYAGAFPGADVTAPTSSPTRMGCPSACTGYELTANLNFDADGMGGVTSTDPYPDWTPIGGSYAAVFDGKGYTISNLTIAGATGNSGLFNTLTTGGIIRDVGMVDASIGNNGADAYAGVLAGDNDGGMIITSYASDGAVTITGTSTYGGGLIGRNAGDLRAVYSTASVTASSTATSTIGGLIGLHAGSVTASYAAGAVTGTAPAIVGGFAGAASSTAAAITNSYCDTDATTQSNCIGAHTAGATATSTGYTTTQLQTPTGYTGIYAGWNIPLGADNMLDDPWSFGTNSQYPTIKPVASRTRTAPPAPPAPTDPTPTPTSTPATSTDPGSGNGGNGGSPTSTDPSPPSPTPDPTDSGNGQTGTSTDTLPPPLPRTIPPEPDMPYNPAADHPEIYNNAEYEMAATCQTHNVDPETGNPQAATVTFDLGTYTGPVLLHLSLWRNGRYMAYETQGLASPALERNGQRATLRVDTDPAQTRFRLDGRRHGLATNLVLGYADCRSDDS